MPKVLIDGDIVAYRAGFATEGLLPEDAEEKVDELLGYILDATTFDGEPYQIYLTGSGNFRYDIAFSYEYKGNRRGTAKPEHLDHIRDYLSDYYSAVTSAGEEADDLIAIEATSLGPHTIIASVDKDFLQVPCIHYNTGKGIWTNQDEWNGLLFFYEQILTGDKADNIVGLKGIGPVKAKRILDGAETERELYERCLEAYDGNERRVIENGQLLWLRREVGQLWQPPEVN